MSAGGADALQHLIMEDNRLGRPVQESVPRGAGPKGKKTNACLHGFAQFSCDEETGDRNRIGQAKRSSVQGSAWLW